MKQLKWLASGLGVVTTVFLSLVIPTAVEARVMSLAQLGCIAAQPSNSWSVGFRGYAAINEDVTIGREIFRAVGRLGRSAGNYGLVQGEGPEITCRLVSSGERPRWRTLTLAFGLPDQRDEFTPIESETARVAVTVYLDGNYVGSRDLYLNDRYVWPIDISGARSLSITAECFNRARSNCPPVIFFQDTLED